MRRRTKAQRPSTCRARRGRRRRPRLALPVEPGLQRLPRTRPSSRFVPHALLAQACHLEHRRASTPARLLGKRVFTARCRGQPAEGRPRRRQCSMARRRSRRAAGRSGPERGHRRRRRRRRRRAGRRPACTAARACPRAEMTVLPEHRRENPAASSPGTPSAGVTWSRRRSAEKRSRARRCRLGHQRWTSSSRSADRGRRCSRFPRSLLRRWRYAGVAPCTRSASGARCALGPMVAQRELVKRRLRKRRTAHRRRDDRHRWWGPRGLGARVGVVSEEANARERANRALGAPAEQLSCARLDDNPLLGADRRARRRARVLYEQSPGRLRAALDSARLSPRLVRGPRPPTRALFSVQPRW